MPDNQDVFLRLYIFIAKVLNDLNQLKKSDGELQAIIKALRHMMILEAANPAKVNSVKDIESRIHAFISAKTPEERLRKSRETNEKINEMLRELSPEQSWSNRSRASQKAFDATMAFIKG